MGVCDFLVKVREGGKAENTGATTLPDVHGSPHPCTICLPQVGAGVEHHVEETDAVSNPA